MEGAEKELVTYLRRATAIKREDLAAGHKVAPMLSTQGDGHFGYFHMVEGSGQRADFSFDRRGHCPFSRSRRTSAQPLHLWMAGGRALSLLLLGFFLGRAQEDLSCVAGSCSYEAPHVEHIHWEYFSRGATTLSECHLACFRAVQCTGIEWPTDGSYCAFWLNGACSLPVNPTANYLLCQVKLAAQAAWNLTLPPVLLQRRNAFATRSSRTVLHHHGTQHHHLCHQHLRQRSLRDRRRVPFRQRHQEATRRHLQPIRTKSRVKYRQPFHQ